MQMTLIDIWLGILQGLGTTATVTAYGLVFAIPFALVFGVAQYLTGGVARLLVTGVIEFWRSSAVIILLLAAAITSALAFLLIHPDDDIPMVGASGAICGLWGLLVRSDLETCTLRSLTAKPVLIGIRDFAFSNLVLFAILFVLVRVTESQGGLAWEGHLGGFLFGLMAAPFFVRQRSLPRN